MNQEMHYTNIKIAFGCLVVLILAYLIGGELKLPAEATYGDCSYETLNEQWTLWLDEQDETETTLPYSFESDGRHVTTIHMYRNLPVTNLHQTWLMFWNRGCNLRVYVDGALREEYNTADSRFFGLESPYCYVFVPLKAEDSGKRILLEFETRDKNSVIEEIRMGDRYALHSSVIRPYMMEIVIAVFLLLLGIICMIAGIWMQKLIQSVIYLIPLSWCVILTSLWILVNDGIRQFYFPNISTVRDVAYFIVALLPVAFILYINEVQKHKYEKIYTVLIYMSLISDLFFTITYMANLMSLTYFIHVTEGLIAIFAVVIIALLVKDIRSGEIKTYWIPLTGVLTFMIAGVIQIIIYAFSNNSWYNGVIFEAGVFLAMVLALINSMKFMLDMYAQKNEALNASAAKARFLANMSHEIRTPINSILGMNEMIMREEQDETILGYSNDIRNAGKSLLSLVNDILDFSKIESGKMELVPVEYETENLLRSCYQLIIPRAKEKDLTLHMDYDASMPKSLFGDELRIRQIIINLLTNAVKYTDEGNITLKVEYTFIDDENVMLCISVKDTGKGISEENLNKLFTAFARVDEKKNRNIEGTGLGLNISREFVHMMGGEISVTSEYGKGSCFKVEIPQKVVNRQPIGQEVRFDKSTEKIKVYEPSVVAPWAKILVVDDVKMNLMVFRNLIKKTQIQVDTANSGAEALKKTKESKYDIIFLDHMMPEMDGIETLRNMKEMEENLNLDTPVIMLTANAIVGAKEEYIQEGFSDYLSKPLECEKLEAVIAQYLPKE